MKNLTALLLALILVLSTGVAFAKDTPVSTAVSASEVEIFEGESVTFTASTLKKGSDYTDEWNGANKTGTVKTGDPAVYASTASKTFNTAGTYTVTYSIVMTAGNSGNRWLASGSVQVVVKEREPVVVPMITGYEVRNCVQGEAILNPAGNVKGYEASGELWAIYDNGTEEKVVADYHFELTPNGKNHKGDYAGKDVKVIR